MFLKLMPFGRCSLVSPSSARGVRDGWDRINVRPG